MRWGEYRAPVSAEEVVMPQNSSVPRSALKAVSRAIDMRKVSDSNLSPSQS